MSAAQLITPNLDPVLHQDGQILTNWVGWCLLYTQTAFGAGWAGSDAWEAWTDHVHIKHEDRNIPNGMYVPIWFSGYHNLGHSAIYKDGQVWCTPLSRSFTATVWNSIAEVEQHYGVTYAGWSEDIGSTQVVEFIPDAPPPPIEVAPVAVPEPVVVLPPPVITPPSPTTITPPATAPSKSYYPIKVELPKFGTLTDAIRHTNPTGTIAPTNTTYYQFNTLQGMISITTVPGQPQRTWINPADNVVQPPKPPVTTILPSQVPIGADNDTAWKATYKSFHIDRSSDPYKTMQTIDMKDYSGKRKTVVLDKGTVINVVGTFVKEGVTFYRPRANNDEYFSWYFGVSMYDDSGNLNLVKVSEPEAQKIEQRFSDFLHYWRDDIKNIWDIFVLRRK